jgi:hypothetical protein
LRLVVPLTLLAIVVSCRSDAMQRYAEDLAWEPETILETAHVTLYSPYDGELTWLFGRVIDHQVDIALGLYDLPPEQDITIRLVPVQTQIPEQNATSNLLRAYSAAKGHAGGYVLGDLGIVVYVPAEASAAGFALTGKAGTIRHELSHDFCRRIGLLKMPRWLHEGLAESVEHFEIDEAGQPLWDEFIPLEVLEIATDAGPGTVDELLSWGAFNEDGQLGSNVVPVRYALSHALVLFLLQRETGRFRGRVEEIASFSSDDLRELESEWLEWMASLDPVATLAQAIESEDPAAKQRAITRMHLLGLNPAYREVLSDPFLRFARDALNDPDMYYSAEGYFLWTAAAAIDDDMVAELAWAEDPSIRLLGQALIVRRGGTPDRDLVRRAYAAMDRETRRRSSGAISVLDLRRRRR